MHRVNTLPRWVHTHDSHGRSRQMLVVGRSCIQRLKHMISLTNSLKLQIEIGPTDNSSFRIQCWMYKWHATNILVTGNVKAQRFWVPNAIPYQYLGKVFVHCDCVQWFLGQNFATQRTVVMPQVIRHLGSRSDKYFLHSNAS